jgi:uncharacterized repeat protein (TIGR01451 family)
LVIAAAVALLVVSGALLFGMGKPAQAQSFPEPPCGTTVQDQYCIDKTATPGTVEVGDQITFTITQRCPGAAVGCLAFANQTIVDTLPPGLTDVSFPAACTLSGNTVACGENRFFTPTQPYTLTIVATATECGEFTNTATTTNLRFNFTAQATYTVVGCPPPTKEECKKGGWEELGFPDQGTCVSAWNRENRR